jgi:putative permease
MLKDGVRFRTIVLKITPNSFFERFYHLFSQLNRQFGDYLLAKFIEAAIVGVFITLGLLLAGIKFSLLFGFIAAITNIIPYIGPIIGAIPAIIWAFSEYGFGQESLVVVTIFLVANVIDLAIVFPILVSKIVDMHPIVVVLSVILGSQFMGVTGMIISIPVAAALKLFFVEIFNSLYTGQR